MALQDEGSLLTIRAAARITGRDERTLRRYLKNGKLSAVSTAVGRRIDRAELLRAGLLADVPPLVRQDTGTPLQVAAGAAGTGAAVEVEVLKKRIAELEADRDAWRDQAQQLARALPAPPESPATSPPPSHGEPKRRPWWRRKLW